MKHALITGSLAAAALTLFAVTLPGQDKSSAQPDKEAIERTRDTTKMLDEIYKRVIVLVTDKYVHDEDDFAAGSAAVELFRQLSEGETQKVRLIDVSGEPYEPENVAKSDFEKRGVQKLKAGAASFDEVFSQDGKHFLRTVTAVPVVHERCVMCHAHYKDAKEGEPIGALSYVLPVR
jgi:hypothetical protein